MESIIDQIIACVRPGQVMANPGGGTSRIKRSDRETLSYIRGHSRMYLPMDVLVAAYCKWCNKQVTSAELRDWRPDVFDSSRGGHSCNCTFFFMVLQQAGLAGDIEGAGKAGSPFSVNVFDLAEVAAA
ncbi:MAG: hypothetical protein H6851_20615 [Geminicoccaceae bacterium]|nr:hypothetical protein [Geminicoccaceae bacterium]MCB9946009.1 hypothetical protein [Geminicoccaceae bacterium]